jgi:prevent-host-death family protein|tara:strand:- start:290 stop:529 length:240 start_codon:yes stop_codon:yes gene_type:complete
MKTVNMHEAKTQLSKLVDAATKGEAFVIAKSGKPLVRVTMLDGVAPQRLGFLKGKASIPEDFDEMFADEVAAQFLGGPE